MNKETFLRLEEQKFQSINRSGKTGRDLLCGRQFLLIKNGNEYSLIPDGLLDEEESFDEVYRLNVFGKLVKMNSYKLF